MQNKYRKHLAWLHATEFPDCLSWSVEHTVLQYAWLNGNLHKNLPIDNILMTPLIQLLHIPTFGWFLWHLAPGMVVRYLLTIRNVTCFLKPGFCCQNSLKSLFTYFCSKRLLDLMEIIWTLNLTHSEWI